MLFPTPTGTQRQQRSVELAVRGHVVLQRRRIPEHQGRSLPRPPTETAGELRPPLPRPIFSPHYLDLHSVLLYLDLHSVLLYLDLHSVLLYLDLHSVLLYLDLHSVLLYLDLHSVLHYLDLHSVLTT